jgi:glycosyltransferase involved in cell wall biosynthesis
VIGTPVGGTREILGKFDPAFLCEDTRAESMSQRIMEKYRYYKDRPGEYQKLSERCRAFVESHYSWERNVDRVEAEFVRYLKDT